MSMLGAPFEKLIRRGLTRSVRARTLCAELAGRSLAIEIPAVMRVRVTSSGTTVSLARDDEPADATLAGGPLGLLALGVRPPEAVLQRGAVVMSGDAELAQKFRELIYLLRPDLEEELAGLVGDVPAHQLGRLARGGRDLLRRAAGVTLQNLADYLAHERGDLVSRNEGEAFLRGVDALREGVDRLSARLELYARRRTPP
jgi:ubiquinone biosynthesis protein UbiJ